MDDLCSSECHLGEKIRVLIVDDSALARAGLRAFLSAAADIDVVGEAPGAEDALAALAELRPDVIVIDVRVPGIERFARRASSSKRSGHARLVVLTSSALDEHLVDSAGATSVLLPKQAPREELIDGVRAVVGATAGRRDRQPRRRESLTEREREITDLVVRGLSNEEIASRLYVSLNTVKSHTKHIYMKLGVRGRQELIVASNPRIDGYSASSAYR